MSSQDRKEKFTSGPWKESEPDYFNDITISPDLGGIAIAAVTNGEFMRMGGKEEEHRANAHLIVAAPELYEALNEVMTWIDNWDPNFSDDDEWPETRDKVIKALSKARGET